MGQVSGIKAKLSMDGVDLGTKSMNNIMQSAQPWAKAILEADRAAIKNATTLNPNNSATRGRYSVGNGNLYGALGAGLALKNQAWQSRDPSVTKAFGDWTNALNQCASFTRRSDYTPAQLLQFAADYKAAACQLNTNMKELRLEAEVGPNDLSHWKNVADGMNDMAAKLENLHSKVCAKDNPNITKVTLDIPGPQH